MPYDTIQQISNALVQHSVRIDAAQSDADFAQSESARALSSIYDTGLASTAYTNAEIQKLRDALRIEFQQADATKQQEIINSLDLNISSQLPDLLNQYYGNYAGMQALYDQLLVRFGQSDLALDHLLNNVVPGLQQNVDTLGVTAGNVAQNFNALEQSLKSVLIVYATNAAGASQSLIAGTREYVQYVEYNGTVPILPVSGTFTKFVGTAQSIWPIYATSSIGQNQSFEPGTRTYVTFYESPVAPDLPVAGQLFVKYVGDNGTSGERGAGVWYVSVSSLPTASSTAARDAWIAAVAAGQDIPAVPKIQDQVFFYTGTQGNPSGQRVFICQWVTNASNHGWDYQEHVMRGDLLVGGTVTSNEIDARGLTIRDEFNNIILQATGGSAGLDLNRVIGAGDMAGINNVNTGNVSTYISNAAIGTLQIGLNSATAGDFYTWTTGRTGNGMTNGYSTAFQTIIVPPFVEASILMQCIFGQGYPNWPTTGGWGYYIGYLAENANTGSVLTGGVVASRVNSPGGMGAATDTPVVGRVFNYDNRSRNYPVELYVYCDWYGQNNNINVGNVTMSLLGVWR